MKLISFVILGAKVLNILYIYFVKSVKNFLKCNIVTKGYSPIDNRHTSLCILRMREYPIDEHQMSRIERIKAVFGDDAMDEAPLAIVHADGDESQPCHPLHRQHTAADDSTQQQVAAQGIEHDDEGKAGTVVVGSEKE